MPRAINRNGGRHGHGLEVKAMKIRDACMTGVLDDIEADKTGKQARYWAGIFKSQLLPEIKKDENPDGLEQLKNIESLLRVLAGKGTIIEGEVQKSLPESTVETMDLKTITSEQQLYELAQQHPEDSARIV